MASDPSGKKKCECICPCKDTEQSDTISMPALPGGVLAAREPGSPGSATQTQVAPTDAVQLNVSAGVRLLDTNTARSTESTVVPGAPGEDVFVVPSLYLPQIDAGADVTQIGGGWIGVTRPGGAGADQRGGGGAHTTWKFIGGQWVESGPDARPERGSKEEDGRAAGPPGQFKRVKLTEEQEKRVRTDAQIEEAERPTVAKKPALTPGGKQMVSTAKEAQRRLSEASDTSRHELSQQQKRIQADMAKAGISTDLPQGPGAVGSQMLSVKDPFDRPDKWSGDFDVTAKKGAEAYAAEGLAAAKVFQSAGQEDLRSKRQQEQRFKRVTAAGAGPSSPSGAGPAPDTIRASTGDVPAPRAEPSTWPTASATDTIRASSPAELAPGESAQLPRASAGSRPDRIAAVTSRNSSASLSRDTLRAAVLQARSNRSRGTPEDASTNSQPSAATPRVVRSEGLPDPRWRHARLQALAQAALSERQSAPGAWSKQLASVTPRALAAESAAGTWPGHTASGRSSVGTADHGRKWTSAAGALSAALRSRGGVRPSEIALSLGGTTAPGDVMIGAPTASAGVDLGAFGSGSEVASVGGSGVRAVAEPSAADHAVDVFGVDALSERFGALQTMTRPGRSSNAQGVAAAAVLAGATAELGLSVPSFGAVSWKYSALAALPLDDALGTMRTASFGQLDAHRNTALRELAAWVEGQASNVIVNPTRLSADGHVMGGGVAGREYDKESYARARKAMKSNLSVAIRKSLIDAWKKGGKKGPKPTSDQAEAIAEGLLSDAERIAAGCGPTESGGADGAVNFEPCANGDCCAEERAECEKTCPCPCECGTAGGGGGDGESDFGGGRGSLTYFDSDMFDGRTAIDFRPSWTEMTWASSRGLREPTKVPMGIWVGVGAPQVGPVPGDRALEPGEGGRAGWWPSGDDLPGVDAEADDGARLRLSDLRERAQGGAPPPVGTASEEPPAWDELSDSERDFLLLLLTSWIYADPATIARDEHPYFEFVPILDTRFPLRDGVVFFDDGGLKAGRFRYRGRGGPVVLAFQGSVEGQDWVDDGQQGFLPVNETQYERAQRLARALSRRTTGKGLGGIESLDPTVDVFVGHSLGGGLAQFAALVTGLSALTLNPAPLHPSTKARAYDLAPRMTRAFRPPPRVVNYSVRGDPVSDLATRFVPGYRLVGETRRIPRAMENAPQPPRAVSGPVSDNPFVDYVVQRALDVATAADYGARSSVNFARNVADAHMRAEGLEEYIRAVRSGIYADWEADSAHLYESQAWDRRTR